MPRARPLGRRWARPPAAQATHHRHPWPAHGAASAGATIQDAGPARPLGQTPKPLPRTPRPPSGRGRPPTRSGLGPDRRRGAHRESPQSCRRETPPESPVACSTTQGQSAAPTLSQARPRGVDCGSKPSRRPGPGRELARQYGVGSYRAASPTSASAERYELDSPAHHCHRGQSVGSRPDATGSVQPSKRKGAGERGGSLERQSMVVHRMHLSVDVQGSSEHLRLARTGRPAAGSCDVARHSAASSTSIWSVEASQAQAAS